jgi:hypothetical protein
MGKQALENAYFKSVIRGREASRQLVQVKRKSLENIGHDDLLMCRVDLIYGLLDRTTWGMLWCFTEFGQAALKPLFELLDFALHGLEFLDAIFDFGQLFFSVGQRGLNLLHGTHAGIGQSQHFGYFIEAVTKAPAA